MAVGEPVVMASTAKRWNEKLLGRILISYQPLLVSSSSSHHFLKLSPCNPSSLFSLWPRNSSILLSQGLHPRGRCNIVRGPRRRLLPADGPLPTPAARTLALLARTFARRPCAPTGRHVAPGKRLHRLLILRSTTSTALPGRLRVLLVVLLATLSLSCFQVCETAGLGMDITDLLVALRVEIRQLLARGCSHRLLEVARHATPSLRRSVCDAVIGIQALGLIGSLVFLVECHQRVGEAGADAVLVVELDGALEGIVGDDVAVSEVLGDDAGAGLVFLGNVVGVGAGIVVGCGGATEVVEVGG